MMLFDPPSTIERAVAEGVITAREAEVMMGAIQSGCLSELVEEIPEMLRAAQRFAAWSTSHGPMQ